MGRWPKATALKAAEGNPGKRRLNQGELREEPEAPRPPRFLDKEARAQWRRVVPVLMRRRLLRSEDQMNLANICQAWSDLVAAREALAKLPLEARMLVKNGGGFMVNPLHYLIKTNVELIAKLGAQYGFSPAARARLDFDDEPGRAAGPVSIAELLDGHVEHDESDPPPVQ